MDALVGWFAHYGPWGLILLMLFYDRWRFSTGDVVSGKSLDRERQGQRDLASSVDRVATSLEHNTDAVKSVQEGQESILHALSEFQRAREEQR